MRGRKPKRESRAAEIRQRLVIWKQMPESMRPSLRALARELCVSHELLRYYLDGLQRWVQEERYREAKRKIEEIRARANAENRPMTQWEEEQADRWHRTELRSMIAGGLFKQIEKIRKDASRLGYLDQWQVKTLKMFVPHGFPGAQDLLQRYPHRRVRPQEGSLEMRIGKLSMRLEAIGGFLWLEDGEVRYFVPSEDAAARDLLVKLYKHRDEVKRQVEKWTKRLVEEGRYDEIRAKICQYVPIERLSALDRFGVAEIGGGNPAKAGRGEAHGNA